MGLKTKNMYCPRCGPVIAVKRTHGVRNTASFGATMATGNLLPLFAGKVETYACPQCGGLVHGALTESMLQARAAAAAAPKYFTACPYCGDTAWRRAGEQLCHSWNCKKRIKVLPPPEDAERVDVFIRPTASHRDIVKALIGVMKWNIDAATDAANRPTKLAEMSITEAELLRRAFEGYGAKVEFRPAEEKEKKEKLSLLVEDLKKVAEKKMAEAKPEKAISVADELGRLAELHERGVLTDAEFVSAKAKILNSWHPYPSPQGRS